MPRLTTAMLAMMLLAARKISRILVSMPFRVVQNGQPCSPRHREIKCGAACRAAASILALAYALLAASPHCDPGNGGLQLPPGFCAMLVVDGIGPARHIAVAPNGDIYVGLQD